MWNRDQTNAVFRSVRNGSEYLQVAGQRETGVTCRAVWAWSPNGGYDGGAPSGGHEPRPSAW